VKFVILTIIADYAIGPILTKLGRTLESLE